MYVKPPNQNRERIKVPENYRGNVFASSGEYTDMPPPARISSSSYDLPPDRYEVPSGQNSTAEDRPLYSPPYCEPYDDTPINDSRERYLADLREHEPDIKNERREDDTEPVLKTEVERSDPVFNPENEIDEPTFKTERERPEPVKSSILSCLLPPSSNTLHFPFGHGIGTEELLILGMMLLVFLNGNETGEPDNEFLLLLALLLFAG